MFIGNFIRDEQGQDLIEYTLLIAFVALLAPAAALQAFGVPAARVSPRLTLGLKEFGREQDEDLSEVNREKREEPG